MISKNLIEEAKKLRAECLSYKEISQKMNIKMFCARHMCTYKPKRTLKIGPKFKITKKINLRIKRAISHLQSNGEKI